MFSQQNVKLDRDERSAQCYDFLLLELFYYDLYTFIIFVNLILYFLFSF